VAPNEFVPLILNTRSSKIVAVRAALMADRDAQNNAIAQYKSMARGMAWRVPATTTTRSYGC